MTNREYIDRNQEAFDRVCDHLLTQNRRAKDMTAQCHDHVAVDEWRSNLREIATRFDLEFRAD